MSKLEIQRRKLPDDEPPILLVDSFISDTDMKYLDEHGWYALAREYRERFGKRYPGFAESDVSVKKYMEQLRAQFPGENLDELIDRYTDHRTEEEKRAEQEMLVDDLAQQLNQNS